MHIKSIRRRLRGISRRGAASIVACCEYHFTVSGLRRDAQVQVWNRGRPGGRQFRLVHDGSMACGRISL